MPLRISAGLSDHIWAHFATLMARKELRRHDARSSASLLAMPRAALEEVESRSEPEASQAWCYLTRPKGAQVLNDLLPCLATIIASR